MSMLVCSNVFVDDSVVELSVYTLYVKHINACVMLVLIQQCIH